MCSPHLCSEFNEEEKDHILPLVLYGQVEGIFRVSLEHVIEQRSTELSKVTRVQITLRGGVSVCVSVYVCVSVCWACGWE